MRIPHVESHFGFSVFGEGRLIAQQHKGLAP